MQINVENVCCSFVFGFDKGNRTVADKNKPDQEPVEESSAEDVAEAAVVEKNATSGGDSLDVSDPADEVTFEAEAEAEAEATPVLAEEKIIERTVKKRSGFVPALIGGVVAAGIGFVVGNGGLSPQSSGSVEAIAALEAKLVDQSDQIAKLTKSLNEIPDVSGLSDQVKALSDRLPSVESDLGTVNSSLETLVGQVGLLDDRLTALEKRPIEASVSAEASAAFEAELKNLRDSLALQRGEVEKMVADAQALEAKASAELRTATNTAILPRLHGLLDAGRPYTELVAELNAGGVDVPDALAVSADKGVETLSELRASFAPAARTALADARDAEKGTGVIAFLRRQTGARSVTPQEGDDPDAILSRAQAALVDGDLSNVLRELNSLPEAAQPALADWEQAAQTRLSAVEGANALASSMNSN